MGTTIVLRRSLLLLVLIASPAWLHAQSAQELFQQALVAERAAGRIQDAVALYQRAIKAAGADRVLAARALVRLGAAYEMLGRSEARAAYGRVIKEFGDQPTMVAQAQSRLAAMEAAVTQGDASQRVSVAREVWADNVVSPLARPSPDGRLLSFTDWETGDLAVRDLQRRENRRLTNKGPWEKSSEFAEQSVFSGDGERIAYSWFADENNYELRTISTRGGESRTVPLPRVTYVQPLAWTPAGDAILVALELRSGEILLAIVKLNGDVVRLADLGWGWTTSADVSPDGRWIVFDQAEPGSVRRDVHIIATDGARQNVLVRHAANDWHPMWTPDGAGVAFLSDRTGTLAMWLVPVTDGVAQGGPRVLKGDWGNSYPMGFTRTGGLFYSPNIATTDIAVAEIEIDSARVRKTRQSVTRSFVGQNQAPDWSPDGKSLAYISLRGSQFGLPGERVLVTLNIDSGEQREFDLPLSLIFRPRWSNDGRHISLIAKERGKARSGLLYNVDLETGKVIDLTPAMSREGVNTAILSIDERSIIYVREDSGRASLHRFTIESGANERLYSAQGRSVISTISPSPDNRWIAITSRENQGTPLSTVRNKLLAREDGRVIRDFGVVQTQGLSIINWSPDSRYIITSIQADSREGQDIWRLPIDGSPPRKFTFDAAQSYISQLRLSRDGKRIAFVAGDLSKSQTSIWEIAHLVPPAPARSRSTRR